MSLNTVQSSVLVSELRRPRIGECKTGVSPFEQEVPPDRPTRRAEMTDETILSADDARMNWHNPCAQK